MPEIEKMLDNVKEVPSKAPVVVKTEEEQWNDMFESLITQNYITDEVTVGNIKLVLHPLSTSEFLDSESVGVALMSSMPRDVVDRVRLVSTLAYAIVSINGIPVPETKDTDTVDHKASVRKLLFKLPPSAIDHINTKYKELAVKQEQLYVNIGDNIENF